MDWSSLGLRLSCVAPPSTWHRPLVHQRIQRELLVALAGRQHRRLNRPGFSGGSNS
jgi:hypothetical protein